MSRVLPRVTGLVAVACFACLPRVPVYSKAVEFNGRCPELVRVGRLQDAPLACDGASRVSTSSTEVRRPQGTLLVSPSLADSHRKRGVDALAKNRMDEAINELERATQIDPSRSAAWGDLGAAYFEATRYDDAGDAYQSCLAADPDDGRCAEGLLRSQLGNPYTVELTSLLEHLTDASRRKRKR